MRASFESTGYARRGSAAVICRFLFGLALGATLAACATPTERVERLAASSGFQKRVVTGDPFKHVVFVKLGERPVDGFRVYLEGDGTPWITRRRVAVDPTPRRPLMLKLMALDPGPALYLGRPCYLGEMERCKPMHWTRGRYSATVVGSLAAALGNIRRQLDWRGEVTLAGHSGGGTLAMLLAPRLASTTTIVTLAANLDIDRWTQLHGYSPLSESLDPSAADPLPERIRQIHVIGGQDRNVPEFITRAGVDQQNNAALIRFPQHGHHCCWEEVWRSILDRL